jgi:hypothetical protein
MPWWFLCPGKYANTKVGSAVHLASIYKPQIEGKFRANFQWCQAIYCGFED